MSISSAVMTVSPRVIFIVCVVESLVCSSLSENISNNGLSLPKDIIFGVSSSAYQIEGAWNLSGKGESIWDRYTHRNPTAIADNSNGDETCDSYHNYKEDVRQIRNIGFQMYKFSVSWSRVLPKGTVEFVNQKGLDYYSNLIDELLAKGIEPMVSLYHWDLPQILQDHGGWLNSSIVTHFENYSRVLFQQLGSRVKWWLTIEDPVATAMGYGTDETAPGLAGLHGFGEYRAGQNLLRAHAAASAIYRTYFAKEQRGKISFNLRTDYIYPKSNSSEDLRAQETAMQFTVGWFGHPVYSAVGDYPPLMRDYVDRNSALEGLKQSRLPYLSRQDLLAIRGSSDFLALSHMTSRMAEFGQEGPAPSWGRDSNIVLYFSRDWPQTGCEDMRVVPDGFRKIISWLTDQYGQIPMFVTENGFCDRNGAQDDSRVQYYKDYLKELAEAKNEGFGIIGYCTKSLLDSFEWKNGFKNKYGLVQVNFTAPSRTRTLKTSGLFWKNLLSASH